MIRSRSPILAITILLAYGPVRELGAQADPKAPPAKEPTKQAEGERVVVTEQAAAQLRKFLTKDADVKYLRVSITDTEPPRLKLDLDPKADPKTDVIGESRGIPVAVDKASATALPRDLVVDFEDEGGKRGFKFASPGSGRPADTGASLAEARKGFTTTLRPRKKEAGSPAPDPPADVFEKVQYQAAPGKLAAYVTPDPKDGKKHPAIVWITGGDCNSIDQGCWREGPAANDQSAAAYRKAGVVMMFPSPLFACVGDRPG
jgi:Fe-S cluster assembly iron-binding protein IscA